MLVHLMWPYAQSPYMMMINKLYDSILISELV